MNSFSVIKQSIETIRSAMKTRRIALALTQDEAARRAGIAAGTLKRFERTGEISLERLVCLMKLYGMESRIIPAFADMSWWLIDEIERAEKRRKA
jgi:transcriptional regulator with XRE-family HTH domain